VPSTVRVRVRRARITCRDNIERRDVLEPFRLLSILIESSHLLRKLFHPFDGQRLAWARGRRRSDSIAIDGPVGRVWRESG
jgi:hypothetical protein